MNTLSVVIPSHNRHDILHQVLIHLAEGSVQPDEVVVVDDGSNPPVSEALDIDAYSLPSLSVLRHETGKGAASARNAGARKASQEIVVFIDDDVFPDKHCLRYHQQIHQANPASEYGVMGRIYFDPDLNRTPLMHYLEEVGNFVAVSKGEDRNRECRGLISANFSLKRAFIADKDMLFDENFPYSQTEDTEFGVRMVAQGWDLHYHIAPSARHHSPFFMQNFFDKVWQGGVSKAYWSIQRPDDTMFVEFLLQVIQRKSQEGAFKTLCEKYTAHFGADHLNEDMAQWDAKSYRFFLTWMRNAMEWWRDLGMYEGWMRFVPNFALIANDVLHASQTNDPEEQLSCLASAWAHNKSFLPLTLVYADALAKAGDYVKALSLLEHSGEFLSVLQRRMLWLDSQLRKDEGLQVAQQLYDCVQAPIFTHQRYRQRAIQKIMELGEPRKLKAKWIKAVWKNLDASDLSANLEWVSWMHTEARHIGCEHENPSIQLLITQSQELNDIESGLRKLCSGHVDFMEHDGSRTLFTNALELEVLSGEKDFGTYRNESLLKSHGVITWYTPEKDFGFICADDDANLLFMHGAQLEKTGSPPVPGMHVAYIPHDTLLGLEALDVTILP